jgi:hypothetical protein
LAARLQPLFPGVEVTPIFRPTGAQELYFSDTRETSALCYWRISHKDSNYLLPCPGAPGRFEGVQGFQVPSGRLCSPESLQVCVPAILRRKGSRWEIDQPGSLG